LASGVILFLGLLAAGPLWTLASGRAPMHGDWRNATHRSSGLAPDPTTHSEAVVQVYAARVFGLRGAFAVHTWLAAKAQGAKVYTRYEVIGWYAGGDRSVVSISNGRAPDAEWYGAVPVVLVDLRGAPAQAAIDKLPAAIGSYPYPTSYGMWPGPNSNTFTAHLAREIRELHLTLPSTAIGKDFLPLTRPVAPTPSGTGYQVSLLGLLGASVGAEEGLELNVLGCVFGIDPRHRALKVPGLGRVPETPGTPAGELESDKDQ
jgi:Protein of unknown function (DUF3750)